MARSRCLVIPARNVILGTRKRSLASRAEARELIVPERDAGIVHPSVELARVLQVKNADESMLRLEEVLDRSTALFRNSPDFAIPEVRFNQIEDGRFPFFVTRQVNRRGVLVVRNVVPKDTALRWRDDLLGYLEENGLDGEPAGVRNVFWSRPQVQAREDVRIRKVLSALNRLWKPDPRSAVDLSKTLSYCDRAFVGVPTCSSELSGGGAVMAGGPSAYQRWTNPLHQEAYREIFDGRWEDWNPFKAGPRIRAAEAADAFMPEAESLMGHGSPSSPDSRSLNGGVRGGAWTPQAFRPFQGYLALGLWGELGNVHVVPMMRVATAYVLLRPFASDVFGSGSSPEEDWMCGAHDGPELRLSPKWHQPVLDALVRLPPLSAGDAVFWHTDVVHCEASAMSRAAAIAERARVSAAAEAREHSEGTPGPRPAGRGRGDDDGIGRFDPDHFVGIQLSSMPICQANSSYVKAQAGAFMTGNPPPGFSRTAARYPRSRLQSGPRPDGEGEVEVEVEAGGESRFAGRATREDLTRGGEQAMGMRSFHKEHYNVALEEHHRLLDLPYVW